MKRYIISLLFVLVLVFSFSNNAQAYSQLSDRKVEAIKAILLAFDVDEETMIEVTRLLGNSQVDITVGCEGENNYNIHTGAKCLHSSNEPRTNIDNNSNNPSQNSNSNSNNNSDSDSDGNNNIKPQKRTPVGIPPQAEA